MVVIEEVKWLSQEGMEAEVIVSNAGARIICFAHPFNKQVGETILTPLQAFDTEHISISDEEFFLLLKLEDHFSYKVVGKLEEKSQGLIGVEGMEIEVDAPIPGDINEGTFVSFTCRRLDLL